MSSFLNSKEEKNAQIHVGKQYQAQIPVLLPNEKRKENEQMEKSVLVWRPKNDLSQDELDSFVLFARQCHGYSEEQSLGVLFHCEYKFAKAYNLLQDFVPSLKV